MSGVAHAANVQLKRKIVLSNQFTITLWMLSIPLLALCIFVIKQPLVTYIALGVTLISVLVPYLNHRGYITFTRISFCLLASFVATFAPLLSKIFYPEGIGVNMYYAPRFSMLALLALPVLLIDLSEKKTLLLCLLIHGLLFVSFDWIDHLFGVGFYQVPYKTGMYYNFTFYAIIYFLFLLSALFYLQINNKTYELEITDLNKSLDQRVKQKTRELENANTNLAAFNYMVSHELKTPLTAAQMLSETVMARYKGQIDMKGIEQISTLHHCMDEMQNLIKSILAFSSLTDQIESISVIDMNRLVKEAIGNVKYAIKPDKTEIDTGQLHDASGDKALIKQVWINLLSNALKYAQYKEHIKIQISSEREDGFVIYSIKDNGAGFSMKEKGKLFQLFGRLHSKAKYEGTGIGLAICRKIINMHGGRIWAEGVPDEGAVFYFSLPEN